MVTCLMMSFICGPITVWSLSGLNHTRRNKQLFDISLTYFMSFKHLTYSPISLSFLLSQVCSSKDSLLLAINWSGFFEAFLTFVILAAAPKVLSIKTKNGQYNRIQTANKRVVGKMLRTDSIRVSISLTINIVGELVISLVSLNRYTF